MSNTENQFEALGLNGEMLEAIKTKGFETPTQIQKLVIPALLEGDNDLIAQSQTGTGKTATFGLPIMQKVDKEQAGVKAIVLVPTRELALQAAEELLSFNAERKLSITAIYGGAAMNEQLRRLSRGVDIVVGTPGRLLDHIRRGTLKLGNIQYLVLDEADEMLNMGFLEDVEEIMSHTPEQRRVMLFSATMPQRIVQMSNKYMRNTQLIKAEARQLTTELTEQIYFEVREADKFDALTRIIDIEHNFYAIVFCRTKNDVDDIASRLSQRGYSAEGLHGDVSQASREKILRKFRDKSINILVATDVAARGIDVNNLSHVINYALPQDSESYVHRIGRTGRAGNQGTAITFITKGEMRKFGFIKRDIKAEIKLEELPSPEDIVATKRKRIINELSEIIEQQSYTDYQAMANELLETHSAEVALASLIRLAYQEELDQNRYPEIRSFSVDRKGSTRLFLAVGKKDDFTPRKIADMLKEKCGVQDRNINDIAVLDNYSVVNIPFTDAENIVRKLGAHRGRPMAEITKESQGGEGGRGGRGGRRERPMRSTPRVARKSEMDDNRRDRGDRSDRRDRGDRGRRFDDRGQSDRRPTPKQSHAASPSVLSTEGFDWSIFEDGGKTWDNRPSKSAAPKSGQSSSGRGGRGGRGERGSSKPFAKRPSSAGGRRGRR